MAKYRFTRADFGPLSFIPLHYDLLFDIVESHVRVISKQTYLYTGNEKTNLLKLNSHDLKVEYVGLFETHNKLGKPPVGLDAKIPNFVEHVASQKDLKEIEFDLNNDERILSVKLPKDVESGDELVIKTISTCYPNDRVLEGIYFDYTPPGAPQTKITQCQQYGFQRIVPCVDSMVSKTFYTTTIIADKRYTNLVTNGDPAPDFIDQNTKEIRYKAIGEAFGEEEGKQFSNEPERKVIRFYNHKVNMAPYLFFLGVGTYEVFKRIVEYPDGDSFLIELFCFPTIVKQEHAFESLNALHDSILWNHLSCGPEASEHEATRQRIYELIKEREDCKYQLQGYLNYQEGKEKNQLQRELKGDDRVAFEEKLANIRNELKELIKEWKETGYKYTGSIYREIAMENSNYGGMENVGNTTIISSRLTPSNWLVDGGYIYMEGVKIHEYYHNINGSQVTGASPFEIWLNEAVTVHIQRQREDELFGEDFMRLADIKYFVMPVRGPLAQDRSPVSMAIEPAGFNTTHELISSMTYSKAPEFVRMVESILGKPKFNRALENYHQKYAFSNATTRDWIHEMQIINKSNTNNIDLHEMASGWLTRTGYPTINVDFVEYNAETKRFVCKIHQTGFENHPESERHPWIVPISWSLVKDGKNIQSGLFILSHTDGEIDVEELNEEPDFISLAKGWSFYGDVVYSENIKNLSEMKFKQALSDPDTVNRYLAVQYFFDLEKLSIIKLIQSQGGIANISNIHYTPSTDFIKLYGTILLDENIPASTKGGLLDIPESITCFPEYSHLYREIYVAKVALQQAIFNRYAGNVLKYYEELLDQQTKYTHQRQGLNDRPFIYICYAILASGLDSAPLLNQSIASPPELASFNLLKSLTPLLDSFFMSLRVFALRSILELNNIDEGERARLQKYVRDNWTTHPIGCEQYVICVASIDTPRAIETIRELIDHDKSPFFNVALSGHARAASAWARNRKRSILTEEGLAFTIELFLFIGKVNQMSAYGFIDAFSDMKKLDPEQQKTLVDAIQKMLAGLDPKEHESLYNRLSTYLPKE